MKSYQNQLDRFRDIAKKLVDDHSADLFDRGQVVTDGRHQLINDAYFNHLDALGKQLDEQAAKFIGTHKAAVAKKSPGDLTSDVWNVCRKYLDQFVKRNQP